MRKPISNPKPLPRELVERVAEKHGIKRLAPDHPIYSEGPTIVLALQLRGLLKPEEPEGEPADPAMVKGKGEEGSEQ